MDEGTLGTAQLSSVAGNHILVPAQPNRSRARWMPSWHIIERMMQRFTGKTGAGRSARKQFGQLHHRGTYKSHVEASQVNWPAATTEVHCILN